MKKVISVFMLAMINVAAICNIANLPVTAKHGFSSLFYCAIGALLFFIPTGLVSAELATGWPQRGGVYIWVREALGEKMGFVAIWLQWFENVVWYPTILSYVAATIAYIFTPKLAENKLYIMSIIVVIFWGMTLINFLGMKISGWISTICVVIGIFIPAAIIIGMGTFWLFSHNPTQITFSLANLIPPFSINTLAALAGILLIYGGLEMSAVHAQDVSNPKKNYPIAIALSTSIIFIILALCSLAIAIIVPKTGILFASGTIESIRYFFETYNLSWAIFPIALLMIIGSLGTISTWIVGPTKGLLATAINGDLPPLLQKYNKKNMPINILLLQAIIVTFLSCVFLFMPTVSSSYGLLFYLTAEAYLIMYLLLFISAIILRYKKPDVKRTYKIPFKNIGMWVTASVGIVTTLVAIVFGFIPPQDINNKLFYFFFLIIGIIIIFILPIIINCLKKPSWHKD